MMACRATAALLLLVTCHVAASPEQDVFPMLQYRTDDDVFGARSAAFNLPAAGAQSGNVRGKCVLLRLQDLTRSLLDELASKDAGAVIVILPSEPLSIEEAARFDAEEAVLMEQLYRIPVFFSHPTEELEEVYASINVAKASTPGEQPPLLSTLAINSYRVGVKASAAVAPSSATKFQNLEVLLKGHASRGKSSAAVPTIAVVAHVDSFGLAPGISYGADSDATGVVALVELARLFSSLYSSAHTRGKYDLLFLFTGAGKVNFEGSKRWLESQTSNLPGVEFALCLDSLGGGDDLYFHVSKPPAAGTRSDDLLQSLRGVAKSTSGGLDVPLVHKKINTAQKGRSWEHEQYRLKGVQSATLSRHPEADASASVFPRAHLLDTRDSVNVETVVRNVQILAQTLASHLYNIPAPNAADVFNGTSAVDPAFVEAWLDYVAGTSRTPDNAQQPSKLLSEIQALMQKEGAEVKLSSHKLNGRYMGLFGLSKGTMTIHAVMPPWFDLVLFAGVAVYIAILYFLVKFLVVPNLELKAKLA